MAMQRTPLLMSKILDRGALVAPNEEIVTATESGTRRQTYKQTSANQRALVSTRGWAQPSSQHSCEETTEVSKQHSSMEENSTQPAYGTCDT